MARNPHRRVAGVYIRLLERLLPRLEESLASRLARLESTVAAHELAHAGPLGNARSGRRRSVEADLGIDSPSVILLGARLRADQRFCRILIHRATAILGGRLR